MRTCKRISLRQGIDFHGHLGPYLILGLLAGEEALKKLKSKKYFGLDVRVWGATKKPKSCLIDGLQLSTGATYGKGNIKKLDGKRIKVECVDRASNKIITLSLAKDTELRISCAKTHAESEILAKRLYTENSSKIFNIR